MALKICGHRVLVKPLAVEEVDEVFASAKRIGIQFVNEENNALRKNAVDRGYVVQIGSTAYDDFGGQDWVTVGDEVFFSKYAGKTLTDPYTNESFVALNDEDIVAIIQKENLDG